MAVNQNQELIWQGRIHIGDEPGVYGDADYSGLSAELPITVYRSDTSNSDENPFKLILETENLETYTGYAGHEITVTTYEPDPATPYHSVERVLATTRFTTDDSNRKEVDVTPGATPGPFFISVRLRVDTTVNPGFYDDFVWKQISLISTDFEYYSSIGFNNP